MANLMQHTDILNFLQNTPLEKLREEASKVLEKNKGRHVFVRGLIEFSNRCKRNCRYCGLRTQNKSLERYCLSHEEILSAAQNAVREGADTIVLQSGEGAVKAGWLAEIVSEIHRRLKVPITLCVGEASAKDYLLWRDAGASRYLLKHETSNPALYASLHPGYELAGRIEHLKLLRSLGYELGGGFMLGLPGQSLESLACDIALVRDLHTDMCGAGPFIPQRNTPLGHERGGGVELSLRVISALRFALPWANLPATTALASIDPAFGQINGLKHGANVLMPSFTPEASSSAYQIYDKKNRVRMAEARKAIELAGRSHSLP